MKKKMFFFSVHKMSYSSIRTIDTTNVCFLTPPTVEQKKEPPCPRLPVPWVGGSMPRTNQIYAVNQDPSNPLNCLPVPQATTVVSAVASKGKG